jgi:hypothetical protein
MINILIVCGIKNYDEYHDSIIGIINNINKSSAIDKSLCNFVTLQHMNFYGKIESDLYISNIDSNFCIFDERFALDIIVNQKDDTFEPIKKFNNEYNNKFDYIILEHCPINQHVVIMIPEFIKHYNLLKNNGYLILFSENLLLQNFEFKDDDNKHFDFYILNNIYTKYGNNIYQKKNNNIYNMREHCKNYKNYCLAFIEDPNYTGIPIFEYKIYCLNYVPLPIYDTFLNDSKTALKYLKYKNKYINLKMYS